MTSRALSEDKALNSNSSPEPLNRNLEKTKARRVNVYDAVAGKISAGGFIPKDLVFSSTRDTPSSSVTAAPPEAVLFRKKSAPTRYTESDIYFANERRLRADLPDSDLLKALHCYASDFYSRATPEGGVEDWKSLDETALLALGILMEECSREQLGTTGDLAFTEGEQIEESDTTRPPSPHSRKTIPVVSKRASKKRKIETPIEP